MADPIYRMIADVLPREIEAAGLPAGRRARTGPGRRVSHRLAAGTFGGSYGDGRRPP